MMNAQDEDCHCLRLVAIDRTQAIRQREREDGVALAFRLNEDHAALSRKHRLAVLGWLALAIVSVLCIACIVMS